MAKLVHKRGDGFNPFLLADGITHNNGKIPPHDFPYKCQFCNYIATQTSSKSDINSVFRLWQLAKKLTPQLEKLVSIEIVLGNKPWHVSDQIFDIFHIGL